MWGMKRVGLIVVIAGCALMSSCSWAKQRYQWVKARVPKLTQRAPQAEQQPSLVRLQPTRAQQAEAKRLLRSIQRQQAADTRAKERNLTEQLMLPEPQAAGAPQPTAAAAAATSTTSPQPTTAAATAQPPRPAAAQPPAYADPYAGTRFVPRGVPMPGEAEPTYTEPPMQDAAQLRGLRNPTLPQALPMDIDGKLRSPSTR